MFVTPREVLAGVTLDLLIGDPRWFPHPVRGIGWLAARLERWWRWTGLPERTAGVLFWLSVVGPVTAVVWASPAWLHVFWIWAFLAIRDLDFEAMRVLRALHAGDLDEARRSVAMIVGRDTEGLSEAEILRAVIETVAENISDAVIAPLFYLALGGPAAMAAYKAVNTLDSMVGYKDERYREFGWAAARLDDAANFVPARLTALLVWIAALVVGLNARRAVRVTLRDGRSQPSPNAGYPEAAVAGALGVRLGGLNHYRGVPSRKAYLGDAVCELDERAFTGARKLLYSTSLLMVAMVCGWLAVIR